MHQRQRERNRESRNENKDSWEWGINAVREVGWGMIRRQEKKTKERGIVEVKRSQKKTLWNGSPMHRLVQLDK